jgi:phosphatidylglycerophosphatase GEP4
MVQSLNTKALATLAYVLRHPTILVPHVSVANVSELNYKAMKEGAGIRAIVFDKDNTLTAPYGLVVHKDAARGLESAKEIFGSENVAIMSNSAGTKDDPGYEDAKKIEAALGIAVIRHDDKKPGGLDEVLSHFNMDDPAALCMIGDRLLTDVVFGNLYSMLTVHTLPLCKGADNKMDNKPSRLVRYVENKGLYGNWFGSKLLYKQSTSKHKYWPGENDCPLTITIHLDDDDNNNSSKNVDDDAFKS